MLLEMSGKGSLLALLMEVHSVRAFRNDLTAPIKIHKLASQRFNCGNLCHTQKDGDVYIIGQLVLHCLEWFRKL